MYACIHIRVFYIRLIEIKFNMYKQKFNDDDDTEEKKEEVIIPDSEEEEEAVPNSAETKKKTTTTEEEEEDRGYKIAQLKRKIHQLGEEIERDKMEYLRMKYQLKADVITAIMDSIDSSSSSAAKKHP